MTTKKPLTDVSLMLDHLTRVLTQLREDPPHYAGPNRRAQLTGYDEGMKDALDLVDEARKDPEGLAMIKAAERQRGLT